MWISGCRPRLEQIFRFCFVLGSSNNSITISKGHLILYSVFFSVFGLFFLSCFSIFTLLRSRRDFLHRLWIQKNDEFFLVCFILLKKIMMASLYVDEQFGNNVQFMHGYFFLHELSSSSSSLISNTRNVSCLFQYVFVFLQFLKE